MSNLLLPLIERFRAIPPKFWEDIALSAGCAKSFPRKLISGERKNPRLGTIQPLLDYFDAVDAGKRKLPAKVLRAMADGSAALTKTKK